MGKGFVEESLRRDINLIRTDTLISIINKVKETFNTIVPSFVRKVKFLDMRVYQEEGPIEWASRIDKEADLTDLENLKSQ